MGVISRSETMADLYKGNLTEGSITGTMLRFAFPLMLGNLLQQCYNVADTLIVGRVLGADALAAVGSSYALIVFVTSIFIGLCMGCSAVFSMQYGAREFDGLRRSIFSSMLIVGGVTLVLNVASLLWLTPVIRLLHTPPEVEPLARSYLFIVFLGMVPVCVYNFYAFLLRAVGNSVVPLCFLLVSVVLNIGLDLLFMLGLHMGVEGAALAIAILSKLYRNGACTIATTHYNELKKYALSTEGVQNASMEFDVETLSPTYKLLIGVAGRSNAFEISRKLGLPSDIIDEAGRLIERGDLEFEDVLSAIEEDRKQAERDRDEAAAIIEAARREKADIDAKVATLKEKREKIIEDARAEARDLIREARETASDVAKTLKELEHVPDKYERRKKLSESRAKLREEEDKYASGIVRRINAEPVTADKIKTGDRVKILTLNQNGEVLTLPDSKGDLTVSIGMMKLAVNLKDIALINDGTQKKQQEKKSKYGGLYKSKAMSVSASINVQGKNLEDALMDVEKYIDDVYMAGLEKVTVIHGRGEGILKNGIRDMLRHNKSVKSCRAGTYNEGGEGVTIVTMRRS